MSRRPHFGCNNVTAIDGTCVINRSACDYDVLLRSRSVAHILVCQFPRHKKLINTLLRGVHTRTQTPSTSLYLITITATFGVRVCVFVPSAVWCVCAIDPAEQSVGGFANYLTCLPCMFVCVCKSVAQHRGLVLFHSVHFCSVPK